jgi:hypothetical protein
VTEQAEHARLSPSGSKKWFACPGSLTLEASIPNEANKYSDDGTAKHEIARRCMTEHFRASKWVGELVPVHADGEEPRYVRFTDDAADEVQGVVDTVRSLTIGCTLYLIEHRVDFSDVVQLPGQFGTLDVGILTRDRELQVHDYKFGHTPVEVEKNTQLLIYALALYNELSLAHDIDGIRLFIHQPRAAGTTEWACSVEYLLKFADTVRSRACSVLNAERDYGLVPSEKWEAAYLNPNPNDQECAFCRAMATCPSVARKVQETVGADFHVIADPVQQVFVQPPPSDRLAQAMAAAPLIEDWIKAVRAEVERRLIGGDTVEGFGLELGRKGARRFSDEMAAEELVRKKFRLTVENAFNLSLKSPTQFEKMTKPTPGTDAAGKPIEVPAVIGPRRWKEMQALIVQNDPKPSVKPLSQIKKPYTVPKPDASDFATVQDEDLSA